MRAWVLIIVGSFGSGMTGKTGKMMVEKEVIMMMKEKENASFRIPRQGMRGCERRV